MGNFFFKKKKRGEKKTRSYKFNKAPSGND